MIKFFLDKNGNETRRMAGKPGHGHIEIAMSTEKLDPASDIYTQMFALGYARVVELDTEIHVDAPRGMTKRQKDALLVKSKDTGKPVIVNSREAIESRTPSAKAKAIVEAAIAESSRA